MGHLVTDPVLEYRLYCLFVPWAAFLGTFLAADDLRAVWILAGFWGFLAWKRAYFYSSPFRFWQRAYLESPNKVRPQTRYAEEIMLEIERRIKQPGASFQDSDIQDLLADGRRLQGIITRGEHTC